MKPQLQIALVGTGGWAREQARKNLGEETPAFDLALVARQGRADWN